MSFRESLACGLQKCVGNLWKGDDYSDFIVIVENTSFKCHRFILSACSGFFQGLFKSPMKEQTEGCAKLEGMTSSTFDIIINAVYKGIDGLSIDNVLGVWAASEMLQIGYLIQQCHMFVMENISVDNYFLYFKHAKLYSAEDVVDHCLNFMSRNFKQFKDEDNLLHLPFDQFYKVIADDDLAADHEEIVVDTILNWVKYAPPSRQTTSLNTGNNTVGISFTNAEHPDGDFSSNSLSNNGNNDDTDDQTIVTCDVTSENMQACSQMTVTRDSIDSSAVIPVHYKNVSKCLGTDVTERENRKQYLVQLLSACRLFTIKSGFFDNVMKNDVRLLVDTRAYALMHEALMYTLDVSRRHDAWPDAAVYRASSSFKHVMVFLSGDKIVSYVLDTGKVAELAELPQECKSCSSFAIVIFDSILHLLCSNSICQNSELYMLAKEKTWVKVNSINENRFVILLPHGNNIYCCCLDDSCFHRRVVKSMLYRFCCVHGHTSDWSQCGELHGCVNCLLRFHKYILVFSTKNNVTAVEYYNTETEEIHSCETSMSGTSQDMVSFNHKEDVYILQRNGSLWKLFNTDTTPVDFELVSKLWDFDCSLKGCVLYKQILFIFCNNKQFELTLTSLPGIFKSIQTISIDSKTPCLPMTLKLAL
ncbi:unnamed protein product [Candidula unifasciata]|uniref:BTB domain-containing protein n=1 Tax=Candidula unifasciata TaxID=100452 RepID=A0A8S3ZM63_9EUPU|nr:unnamed protein product [Candidula unifasciata]